MTIRTLNEQDMASIISWGGNTEEYLAQWSNYTYPLTIEQILQRIGSEDIRLLAIEDELEMIGTIQIFRIDNLSRTARVGCYLINPACQGKGYGQVALNKVVEYAFEELELQSINLGVFDYNTGAIRCYEKVGFKKVGEYKHPMGWLGYTMEIKKIDFVAKM